MIIIVIVIAIVNLIVSLIVVMIMIMIIIIMIILVPMRGTGFYPVQWADQSKAQGKRLHARNRKNETSVGQMHLKVRWKTPLEIHDNF